PTYRVLGSEMDSPRGRIYLMRALDEGRAQVTDSFIEHMFRCLDCRACETACPSGVHFGQMMEEMRGKIVEENSTHWFSRWMLEYVFPYPWRFQIATGMGKRIPTSNEKTSESSFLPQFFRASPPSSGRNAHPMDRLSHRRGSPNSGTYVR